MRQRTRGGRAACGCPCGWLDVEQRSPAAVEPLPEAEAELIAGARSSGLPGCGVQRVLRGPRALADLEGSRAVTRDHVRAAHTLRAGEVNCEVGSNRTSSTRIAARSGR